MSWVLSSWFRDGSSGFQSDLYSYELRGFFCIYPILVLMAFMATGVPAQ